MGDTKPFSRYVFFLTGKLSAFKNNDLTKPKVSAIAEYGGGKVVQRASGKVRNESGYVKGNKWTLCWYTECTVDTGGHVDRFKGRRLAAR